MRKVLKFISIFLASTVSVSLYGCSIPQMEQNNEIAETSPEEADDETIDDTPGINLLEEIGETGISIKDIKDKYGTTNNIEIAPFYNVSQNTAFVFHFKGNVEPVHAVTVHTDSKCEIDSMVYQINDGYRQEDGGTEVIVKPGTPVLNRSGKGKLDNYSWGYAPIYYMCVRYSLTSSNAEKLEKPIIIPFTVQSPVSVPNVTGTTNTEGQFEIVWNLVDNAEGYNIYKTNVLQNKNGTGRAECGYVGDKLELVASVDADTTSFNDFENNGSGNVVISSDGFIVMQNCSDLGTYFVTSVDADGNESSYSMAIEGWEYNEHLPKSFDDHSVFEKENGYATVLPDTVPIKMSDGSTARFPISYQKESEENGIVKYIYSVNNTLLTGDVKYKNEDGNYHPYIVSPKEASSVMYKVNTVINIIPRSIVKTKDETEYIDLYTVSDYPHNGTAASYDDEVYEKRAEIEKERIPLRGAYPKDSDPLGMFKASYQDEEIIEFWDYKDRMEEVMLGTPESDWYQTAYDIFADSAEEEYLAICLTDVLSKIDMRAFPNLQNTEYLVDALHKVIYQNPYVISTSAFRYEPNEQVLYVSYSEPVKTIKKKQEKTAEKVDEIFQSYIRDDMSDEDKVLAVWQYLEKNATYDAGAREKAKDTGFFDVGGYEDSFSVYGVLCKGIGVCQSYMHATKLLLNKAGVECKSLTGYLQNTLPHGWNIVQLDGEWYWLDTTNSMTNSGVPYFIYQTSYKFASDSWNYVLDNEYALDDELDFAITDDISKDWYYERGLYAESHNDIIEIIKNKVSDYNGELYIKCSFIPNIKDDGFVSEIGKALREAGFDENEIAKTMYGNIDRIMIIDMHGEIFD